MTNQPINPQDLAQMLQRMVMQGGNPQMLAYQIMQNNPAFASQIQGQNVQQLAMQALQQRGIDPQQFFQILGGRNRQ